MPDIVEAFRRVRPLVVVPFVVTATAMACGSGGSGAEGRGSQPTAAAEQSGQVASRDEPAGPVPGEGMAWVILGDDTVRAEVASTGEQRSQGLMYRDEVPPGTGMLFVFSEQQVRSFWMQNTYVALDIAFINADQVIVDIQQMEPETTELHESRGPAMFALEVPQGWFAEHGIEVGERIEVVWGR